MQSFIRVFDGVELVMTESNSSESEMECNVGSEDDQDSGNKVSQNKGFTPSRRGSSAATSMHYIYPSFQCLIKTKTQTEHETS